jgi:hypothetical protein
MRPSQNTLKRLFALSGNQCAFPKCRAPLTHNDTLLGELCHIKADSPGGPRYDTNQTDAERQAFENLLVLCPTHHTVIDDDEVSFSVLRLQEIKRDRESAATPIDDERAEHIAAVYLVQSYANVGQTGGVSAQNIHAHTINVNAAPVDPITAKRQLLAVETLWKTVRAFRTEFGQLIYCDTIFTREELEGFFNSGWPRNMLHMNEYADSNTVMSKYNAVSAFEAGHERPFVAHRLFSVYYTIRALYGRIGYLFEQSFERSTYRDWRTDNGADQLLRSILPANVVEHVKGLQVFGLQSAFDHLEEQFMAEAKMRAA